MARPIYASLDDLKGRVRIETLLKCLDFARTNTVPDATFRTAIANPSCADIDRRLGGVFPERVPFADIADDPPTPDDLKELALDWYVWRLGSLYPTHMQVDVTPLWVKIQGDVKRIRDGLDKLNQAPPDPARTMGGTVGAIGDDPPCVPPPAYFDNTGDYG